MKKTKRSELFSFICALTVALVAGCFLFACTDEKEPVKADENTVVITANSEDFDFSDKKLVDYLDFLQEKGKFEYAEKDGMVTSVNGKEQAGSSYWMFYTSDSENADESWGKFEHDGTIYGSAKLGIKDLPVKKDCVYIFAYQTF